MELPRRSREDAFLPDGAFRDVLDRLRQQPAVRELRIGIAYAFDFRTRMLPYWFADKRMAPCAVRTLADVLTAAGCKHVRIILQQWTPNFRPSEAVLDGQPLDLLLVSAMQVHAEPAFELIRDAHRLGAQRPLILAGGPKAIYEPTDYLIANEGQAGADCSVTGEAYVLLALLDAVLAQRAPSESLRAAFIRAREEGALKSIPGLVYAVFDETGRLSHAVNTGVQRLLRDLDELPMPDAGFRLLEPPHRGRRLKPQPLAARRVARRSPIASIISTHGCKFNCPYCSIPAVNQRTWRHKSPQRMAAEIKHIHETFGITGFFGTDDNFFNRRETVEELMTALAQTQTAQGPLGERIHFYTEATQFDVFKNQDLLPLCRQGGLRGIWFGIEDITAELVNKGQNAGKTAELFKLLHSLGIEPMAMMIHSDDQPLKAPPGDLTGLLNQARYLFEEGAVSYQCTYLGPAVGTRNFETAVASGTLYRSVGGQPIPQAHYDGNHVVASRHPQPWRRQLNLIRAYSTFYNPWNMLRTLLQWRRSPLGSKRVLFQVVGHIGLGFTIPRMLGWAWRLRRGPIQVWDGLRAAPLPMIDVQTNAEVNWGIEHIPQMALPAAHGGLTERPSKTALPVLQSV